MHEYNSILGSFPSYNRAPPPLPQPNKRDNYRRRTRLVFNYEIGAVNCRLLALILRVSWRNLSTELIGQIIPVPRRLIVAPYFGWLEGHRGNKIICPGDIGIDLFPKKNISGWSLEKAAFIFCLRWHKIRLLSCINYIVPSTRGAVIYLEN